MILKDIEPIPQAMDMSFRFTGDQWASDFHLNLELPGIFKELLQNDTVVDPKTGIRMDLLELAELEGGIEILINIEHQSTRLDTIKIRIIDDYKNYSKCKHKLPLLSVIVSPFPKEEHENEYRATESDVLQPVFITIDDKEIRKRLNILKDNCKNREIENHIILNIAIISIFVLENEYEILKELCLILAQSEGIKGKIRSDMVKVLEEMIKYKLYGNEEQVMELLEMLEEDRQTAKRGMRIWYEEEFAQIEAEHKKELSIKEAQHKKELAEKDESHAIELAEKDEKIAELNTLLKTNGIS
ncbi:hypothetical protein [Methanobrevibacter sp.]